MLKKLLAIFLCTTSLSYPFIVTIKNDTKIDYFIVCDDIGYLIIPQKEVQLDVAQTSWLQSWWHDPSIIALFKKIDDQEGFIKAFYVTPKNSEDKEIIIFISDVQRKARHVSAPFSVKALNHTNESE